MWNLICQGNQSTVYRPTASSGTITNPTNAYDVDAYPWSTYAITSVSGSSVAGTPDSTSVTYTTFPTLAKTAFSTLTLQTVMTYTLTPYNGSSLGFYITCGLTVEYSVDGGSTWLTSAKFGVDAELADMTRISIDPPAQDISSSGFRGVFTTVADKITIYKNIPSTLLSVGLQDLQIRYTASTLKSTRSGNPVSALGYQIWDIQAVVS